MTYEAYVNIGDRPKKVQLGLDERVDPATTALVVIDMQNDFWRADGRSGIDGEDLSLIPPMLSSLKALIAAARKKQIFTIFVRSSYDAVIGRRFATAARQAWRRRRHLSGRHLGIEFVAGTGPDGLPNEAVVTKHSYSPFGGSDIDLLLRSNGIKTVVVAGFGTETSIESFARDAFFQDYLVVVAKDCCASHSRERHETALSSINRYTGPVPVMESAPILKAWETYTGNARGWQAEVKRAKALGTLEARVDPTHTALVLVDVQNDLCSVGGKLDQLGLGMSMISGAMPNITSLLRAARAAGTKIFYLKSEHASATRSVGTPTWHMGGGKAANWADFPAETDGSSPSSAAVESFARGTWGAEIAEAVAPLPGEMVIRSTASAASPTRVSTNCCAPMASRPWCWPV